MANSVGPDQTAPWEQSDLGLHSLLGHISLKTLIVYSMIGTQLTKYFAEGDNQTASPVDNLPLMYQE